MGTTAQTRERARLVLVPGALERLASRWDDWAAQVGPLGQAWPNVAVPPECRDAWAELGLSMRRMALDRSRAAEQMAAALRSTAAELRAADQEVVRLFTTGSWTPVLRGRR